MLETSVLLENSAPAAVSGAEGGSGVVGGGAGGGGSVSDGSGEEERRRGEDGDRNFAGNRWPREETLALLKIRSDMDVAFRDSPVKAPLWDEVARKLAELGYHRSAKKCKEKFENIYKYHKRTKEGRSGRQNGKNYRFFDQLEAFGTQSSPLPSPLFNKIEAETSKMTMAMPMTMVNPISVFQDVSTPLCSIQNQIAEPMSTSTSTTSSSGKESECNARRKRKLGDYFERLMKEVLEKQENLQNKFMEAIEKCERDRIEREEAWKRQEMARIKKEQEVLAHERAVATAKDAAVIAFLQKISDQEIPVQLPENPMPENSIPSEKIIDKQENNFGENYFQLSSSRWPKAEVEALVRIRTNLDLKYEENGPKGPLWEAISAEMKKLGYDRNAKRCKEKWENINKYFKRVKESNKKRPEDAKTCPYFHLLEPLYEKKSKKFDNSDGSSSNLKPEDILMQMMGERENVHQNQENDEDAEEEEDDDDNGDDYQIVANNHSSVTTME
ncbi:unnamed protein product [Ilex paraguariensis]|uniref:Myb-like domain-containing protein n=1 Tax=Ilex paraguariensis TaxID=185542 RepID=A0ABC8QQ10_9AQUA